MAAALERLRWKASRLPRSQISLLLRSNRFFSSSDSPPDVPVQPVSYAAKPKQPAQSEEDAQPRLQAEMESPAKEGADSATFRAFSREDIRFVKEAPVIAPVSYVKKVAPLPEDKTEADRAADLAAEGRRIEADRALKKVFKTVEEEKRLPFPTFVKSDEKKEEKRIYDLQDAIRLVKANAKRNFDETLEAHVNLGIDRRRSDLGVSGSVVLPHGSGKVVRIAVFAEGAAAEEARAAGADVVGGDDLIQQIKNGAKLNFDKCIATVSMMRRVATISRILRALTPNAKKGTVTDDVAAAVKEAKQGLIDFKMKESIVHVGLGKVSYKEDALRENIGAFVNALLLAKPPGLKKTSKYAGYVNSFHLCSTGVVFSRFHGHEQARRLLPRDPNDAKCRLKPKMGPGYQVSIQTLSKAADQYSKSRLQ